jgi:hypothetical protein
VLLLVFSAHTEKTILLAFGILPGGDFQQPARSMSFRIGAISKSALAICFLLERGEFELLEFSSRPGVTRLNAFRFTADEAALAIM